MSFKSRQQEKWAHTKAGTKALGGPSKVAEWQADTPKNIPHRVGDKMKHHSMAAKALAKTAAKPPVKKQLKEMHVKELHSGGYMVSKHMGNGEPPTEHGAKSMHAVRQHMKNHFGDEPEAADNPKEEMAE